jgi:hypothetical protein
MKVVRRTLALLLSLLFILECSPVSMGCGPSYIAPVFVFKGSPDLPFNEFVNGKIGIVKPSFGRKTLVIAHRYLNGGSFGTEEQEGLVEALKGSVPEDDGSDAAKTWVAARTAFLKEREQLLEIYTERQYGGYDFFPNCAKNAFEVATETLKDRAGSYGADDPNVRVWLAAQDAVFQNCGGGGGLPLELGAESPIWLRKDREYQIGAALLYSLRFDEARARFEKIAADTESPWQDTAAYLVARTLVRQASFGKDETRKRQLYEQAEVQLQRVLTSGGKFSNASLKLLGLVKYRLRPEVRVLELGRTLDAQNGNENLRQDLIDYVWLLGKFEAQVAKEEAQRKEAQKPAEQRQDPESDPFMKQASDLFSKQANERNDTVQIGELISITLDQKNPDGTPDYSKWVHLDFKFDASEDEVLQAFEQEIRKQLAPEEIAQIRDRRNDALSHRKWLLSPNQNQNWTVNDYEGSYGDEKLTPDLIPSFLQTDELTDWIFTFESPDPSTYAHALSKWRSTDSPAWLVAALTKAQTSSRGLGPLLRAAEKVSRDAPAFPSVAYHLVRLRMALGRRTDARQLLDDIISWQTGVLPVSAQNQFLEQRLPLATNVTEFLRFAQRRPVTFYEEGQFGTLNDFLERHKGAWSDDWKETKDEFEKNNEEFFRELLPWNDRFAFDEKTTDILNTQFPLQSLQAVSRDPALPDYLRRRLALVIWTRAILLKNEAIARSIAADVVKLTPEMSSVFSPYLNARSDAERQSAALYILLKQPTMSPLMRSGLPASETFDGLEFYFEESWWCPPSDTDYNDEGNEVPKVVAKPGFLTVEQFASAAKEHAALIAIGDGKSYLGKRVIEWAKLSPEDDRVPEALFIAAMANRQYKYGCNSWEYDVDTKQAAETLLHRNYPRSEWIAKLDADAP